MRRKPVEEREVADLDKKIQELASSMKSGKALTSTLNVNQVLQVIMDKISDLFRPDTWVTTVVDEHSGELISKIATGMASEALKKVRLQHGEGIAGWVAAVATVDTAGTLPRSEFAPRMAK